MAKRFQGVYTAIVTPFKEGKVDFTALGALVDMQLAAGVAGIVPIGTTGESPTLTQSEADEIIQFVVEKCKNNCHVIAGVGTNNTASTIQKAKKAEEQDVDGLLVVNPYYNKPTQEGLYLHFKAVADAVDIPIVVYNIKGRTGVNVETDTLLRLITDCKNVIAVKEASGDLEQMKEVIAKTPEDFCVLSGDDGITLDLIKEGGEGVVSVASNLIPGKMVELVSSALAGDIAKATDLDNGLQSFFEGEFIETNPLPIKAGLAMKGLIEEEYRLPMCKMSVEHRQQWESVLKKNNFI